jgi:hypothetical protein
MKLGEQVLAEFVVVQHERDRQILEALKTYFKCGYIAPAKQERSSSKKNREDRLCYLVRNNDHLLNIIIPFFEKHQLKTKKRIDFEKFRQIILMIGEKKHLTESGLSDIKKIVTDMRKYYIKSGIRVDISESIDSLQEQAVEIKTKDKVQLEMKVSR